MILRPNYIEAINNKIYVQVAYKLESQETANREFDNLLSINDQCPKYVVTMDEFWLDNVEGIKHCYFSDFLLMDEF